MASTIIFAKDRENLRDFYPVNLPMEGAGMISSLVPSCAFLEALVMLFQVTGIGALCLTRLVPTSRWAPIGRQVFLGALLGLGVAGAMVGRHDSHFALFAGLTMTALLIGMIAGAGPIEMIAPSARNVGVETTATA